MVTLYVLQLACGKYYVGKSKNTTSRIEDHYEGSGSSWTSKYKPIKIVETIENCDEFDEDKYTLKYMQQYGIDNVRGGSFCEINLNNDNRRTINKMLISSSDKCYNCNETGHFAKNCNKIKAIIPNKKHKIDDSLYSSLFNKLTSIFTSNIKPHYKESYYDEFTIISSEEESDDEYEDVTCYRCKRKGHYVSSCYARTTIYGKNL